MSRGLELGVFRIGENLDNVLGEDRRFNESEALRAQLYASGVSGATRPRDVRKERNGRVDRRGDEQDLPGSGPPLVAFEDGCYQGAVVSELRVAWRTNHRDAVILAMKQAARLPGRISFTPQAVRWYTALIPS